MADDTLRGTRLAQPGMPQQGQASGAEAGAAEAGGAEASAAAAGAARLGRRLMVLRVAGLGAVAITCEGAACSIIRATVNRGARGIAQDSNQDKGLAPAPA